MFYSGVSDHFLYIIDNNFTGCQPFAVIKPEEVPKMALKRNKLEKFLKNSLDVCVYEEIDSTNNEAKRRAYADCTGVTLYVTDCQTAGRGRHGHDFYSPKGSGLYFTLAYPLCRASASIQMITCAAAVAVCEGISALSDRKPSVKWVNDIFIDGKKVAGILAELVTDASNHPTAVIVGIGINLTTAHFPAEFAAAAGSVGDIDPNRLCAEISDKLTNMVDALQNNSGKELFGDYSSNLEVKQPVNSILEKYKKLNFVIGREILYADRDGKHTALAVDIGTDGSLIVEENGVRKALNSGEISVKLGNEK